MKFVAALICLALFGCVIDQAATSSIATEGKFIDVVESSSFEVERKNLIPNELRTAPDKNIVADAEVGRFMDGILTKIESAWKGDKPDNVDIIVTVDPLYYAASSPNEVIISIGTLKDADSIDEVAFLVAHEYAHIILKHHNNYAQMQSQTALVNKAVNFGAMAAKYSEVGLDADSTPLKESTQGDIDKAYMAGFALNRLNSDVLRPSFGREDEREADLLGVDLMTRAGYSPTAYKVVMERLESVRVDTERKIKQKQSEFSGFIDTLSESGGGLQESKLGQVGYLVANSAVSSWLEELSHDHPEEKERTVALASYIKREYRKERNRGLRDDGLTDMQASPVFMSYQNALMSLEYVQQGNLSEAEVLARKSVSGVGSNAQFPRSVFAIVRSLQGEQKKSLINLDRVESWSHASIQDLLLASQIYRQNKQYQASEKILNSGSQFIGSKEPFYPELIALYNDQNKTRRVNQLLEQCTELDAENIIAQCYDQAGLQAPIALESKDEVEQAVDAINEVFSLFKD